MQQRTKLGLLILAALILLGIGVWILLSPFLPKPEQPPGLPTGVQPGTTVPPEPGSAPSGVAPVSQDVKQLQDLAASVVARMGSGSSGTGFLGYEDVLINATPRYRETLSKEQQAMQSVHPASGPAFGILTRVVSNDARLAIAGADVIPFVLQVQQVEDAGNPAKPTRILYKEVTVSFEKQANGGYLVGKVEWKDIER